MMFMLLAARQRPDFRTINRFRSERMKDVLESVFTTILQFLAEEKYVNLEHYFVDGTKIEAEKQEEAALNGLDLSDPEKAAAITSEKLDQAVKQLEAKGNRKIQVSLNYLHIKRKAREHLHEPESVFGQIKNNRGFRRFLFRG
ncbi:viroplasmin and RNaseH domain-containing protein [Paenibacillus phyllosphaerae]|uniref:Viroplasmin and RNaseH domain-containing protein n=1 Tax=Paenibacillus phyllosphaerae TaxID=274593 RepID=A0A7W5AYY4_9BACL|nr:hypothetical protein [Paenibacillus phyllosphaerae]MBB3111024.1 viroplasmin and RNaseH domain-containing protein [Paenibacillus phyllosphaerae]